MSSHKLEQDAAGAQRVIPVIPPNGGWTGNNNLGTMRPIHIDSTRRQTVLKLPEWGPPEVWTISLYIQDTNPLVTLGDVAIKARLEFGVGGSTQIMEVDWENGTEVSKTMNALNVIAEFNESVAQTDLNIGVQIARGGRGGNRNIYNSVQRLALLDAASETDYIQVPNFAAEFVIIPAGVDDSTNHDNVYSADVLIATYPGNQLVQPAIAMVTGEDVLKGKNLPVVAGSRYIKVINNGASQIAYTLYANMYG